MRQSGIDVIGQVPWGWHMCQFYRTQEDLVDTLVPYFMAGLENNELCVWITSQPLLSAEAKDFLRTVVKDIDRYLQSGQLEILNYSQWYERSGGFDSDATVRAWLEKEAEALKRGFAGLRVSGNMSWLPAEKWKVFAEYERKVNESISSRRILAICSYHLEQCGTSQIIEVFSNHQLAMVRDESRWRVMESGERRALEHSLREAGQRLSSVFDFLPDATFVIDKEGKVIAWNKATEAITGVKAADIIGKGGYAHGKAFYGEPRPALVDLVFKSDHELESKYPFLKREGDTLFGENFVPGCWGGKGAYLWGTASLLRDTDGNVTGAIESVRDISEWKRTQDSLRDANLRMSSIIDFLPDATFVIDKEGKVIAWNRATEAITGVKAVDIIGKGGYEHGKAFYGEPRPILVDLVFKSNEELESKYPFLKREGDSLFGENFVPGCWGGKGAYLWGTASLLRDTNGNIAGAIESIRDISDRKLAEAELNFKARIIDSAIDSIFVYDLEGTVLFVNQAAATSRRYTREELIGTNMRQLGIHEFSSAQQHQSELMEKGKVIFESVHFRKDGSQIPVEIHAQLIDLRGQKVILAVVRDITDRIMAEAVQRESEQKFKSIFDTASDGILVAEPESKKIILANKSAAFMLGYRGDEIINLSVPDLHRAEDLEYVLGEFHKFLQGQIWQSIDIPFRRKDGSLLHVDMSAAAINIGERKCMVAVLRDASARKKIEEELSKSNERFRTLVSNIPGAAYRSRCDAEYITEFVSDAIEQISGYPASDFMGNKVRSYPSIIHPEDRQVVQEIILEAVRKKQPYILEYRIIHANGETRWVYERGQGVFDAQGNVLYCDGAIFDFTERKQIDLALREKVRDLEIFHKVAVGRELRLEELKKRIKDLESQLQ